MELIVANNFCIKLEKTATDTFEILKSAYGEECLSKTSVTEWRKCTESENEKIAVGNDVDSIFYVKYIIHHEFVPEK
jgi:hypothetical protein